MIALLIWPAILWQLASFYLGSGNAVSQIKASQADFKQEDQFWLNAEPIVSGLVALGFIYCGLTWAGLYVAIGTLVALAYEKAARSI
ncbi:MAG: hypothetical protein ACXW11_03940 [Methylotenera sp.]